MDCRPYKLLNTTELAEICRQVEAALNAWTSDWLGISGTSAVTCWRAAEFDMAAHREKTSWMRMVVAPEQWVAIACSSAFSAQLAASLIPDRHSPVNGSPAGENSPLLADLMNSTLSDLLRRLAGTAGGMDSEMPAPRFWETGSGAAAVEVVWNEARFALVLGPRLVASMLAGLSLNKAQRAALAKASDALANGRVSLKVTAGEAHVELALLQTIVVGDVITLNTRIDQPLDVLTADGLPFCRAFLGVRDGRRSIQLSK